MWISRRSAAWKRSARSVGEPVAGLSRRCTGVLTGCARAIALAKPGGTSSCSVVLQVTVVQKDCARCHATRSAEEFYRDKHASDGLQARSTGALSSLHLAQCLMNSMPAAFRTDVLPA